MSKQVKASRSRRRWRHLTAGVSCLVILATLAALMLPAVAMEEPVFCEQQEHTHTDSCYTKTLRCAIEEGTAHTHTDSCYGPEETVLTCQKHVHTDDCYRMEPAACQPHTHTDACCTTEQVLICQDPAHHDHTDACYQDGGVVCGYQAHGDGCYESKKTLTCTLPEHVCTEVCAGENRVLVCQEEDHVHDDGCYTRQRPLVCTLEEGTPHVHTDACYETALICTQPEHTHTLACQSDPQADIETAAQWERDLPQELTGIWLADVAAVAKSQLGCAPSQKNFTVDEDGLTQHFYSRYGAWYGQPYAPWNALFAAFCLHYAGVEGMPVDADPAAWVEKLSGQHPDYGTFDLYRPAQDGTPVPGELAFLDSDADGTADRVAIVTGFYPGAETVHTMLETMQAREKVVRKTYDLEEPAPVDETILGYAALPPQPEEPPQEPAQPQVLTQTVQGADFTVTVTYTQEAALPEGAKLRASEYPRDSQIYQTRYAEAAQLYGWTEDYTQVFRLFNIGFWLDQTEVEPAAPVTVQISYPGQEALEHLVTHYGQPQQPQEPAQPQEPTQPQESQQPQRTHQVDATSTFADGTQTVEFGVARFSDFGVLALAPEPLALTGQKFAIYNQATNTLVSNQPPASGDYTTGYLDEIRLTVPVKAVNQNTDNADYYTIQTTNQADRELIQNAIVWELEQVWPLEQYYLKTTIDGVPHYLKIEKQQDGLTLVTNQTDASRLKIYNADSKYTRQVRIALAGDGTTYGINNLGGNDAPPYGSYAGTGRYAHFHLVSQAAYKPLETVPGITPKGTVINVFDYWHSEQDAPDNSQDVNSYVNLGINKDHSLKFLNGYGNGINEYVGANVNPGIVENMLVDGYPVLTPGKEAGIKDDPAIVGPNESLRYLFEPIDDIGGGKKSYRNTVGLLQDQGGYYVYDSTKNFAELNPETKEFTLYSESGVEPGGQSKRGQFFPFNKMEQVQGLTSTAPEMNHYFGLTLTSRFVQRYDGHTNSNRNQDMVFEFSGDDDVWIFIDDVLVADLGGIHDAVSVDINFHNGSIKISCNNQNLANTTIRQEFQEAGQEGAVEWRNGSDTFANNTYHTLRFFYLERGNVDSNLRLKYNLSSYPPTAITKITQYGIPVAGAQFALYKADGNYNKLNDPPYIATTDAQGEIVFVNDEGMPLTVDEIKKNYFGPNGHAVLEEVAVPAGYRKVNNEIHLRYEGANNPVLLCDNTLQSGAYAATNLQVSAPNVVRKIQGSEYRDVTILGDNNEVNGTLFAVVLKYNSDEPFDGGTGQSKWRPLYGSYDEGFTAVDTGGVSGEAFIPYAIQAAQQQGAGCTFSLSPSGSMQANLEGLPGDIRTYYYMATDETTTEYTVAYYWTEGTLEAATTENTWRVEADRLDSNDPYAFDRDFGASISVPNMMNRLAVLKTDEEGKPLNGATFAMYQVKEENGKLLYKVDGKERYEALDGTETVDIKTGKITLADGAAISPAVNAVGNPLLCTTVTQDAQDLQPGAADFNVYTTGDYVIREIGAPVGYQINPTETRVKVTDHATFVHAGNAKDGVVVGRGPGYLAANLREYATLGAVNNTLHWIYTHLLISKAEENFATLDEALANALGGILDANSVTAQRTQVQRQDYWDDEYGDGSNPSYENTLANFWEYNKNDKGEFFSYAIDKNQGVNTKSFRRVDERLYTDIGWSWLEVIQNYDYGKKNNVPGAAYTDLQGNDLSHLYSRSIFVEVSDQPVTCTLEIEKQVVNGTGSQEFTFKVELKDGQGSSLAGSYPYTIYSKRTNGEWIKTPETGQIVDGGTLSLTQDQKAVITGIPKGSQYTVTETPVEGYDTQFQIKPDNSFQKGAASGTMYWSADTQANTLDAVSHVTFQNTALPTLTLKKVSSDTTQTPLSGAQFLLYRVVEEKKEYYTGTAWVPSGGNTPPVLTSNAGGTIELTHIPDGTYYLEEKKAPDGYVRFHGTAVITVSGGKITEAEMKEPGASAPQFTFSDDGLTLTIPNQAGTMLPETGGHGTFLHTLLGALLTLTAAAFLLRKRKAA